jgi:hypothetical protein
MDMVGALAKILFICCCTVIVVIVMYRFTQHNIQTNS